MASITFISVGTLKESYLKEAVAEYKKRLSQYARAEEIELKEETIRDEDNKARRRETARQVAIGVGVTAGLLLVSSGKAKQLASRGKSAATSLINSKTKATVIGKNGKVIRRYFTSRATDLGYGTTSLIPR